MARVVPREIWLYFDGEDVSDEFSKAEFHTSESDSDYLSLADSRAGQKIDWELQGTIAEDHAATSLWSRMMDNPGAEVVGEYAPYGDNDATSDEPRREFTAIVSIPVGGKVMGAEADSSPTQVATVDVTWKLKGKPVKITAPTPPVPATTATAGSPGSFNGSAPANLAAMSGITASPSSAWTTGQHVVLGDASKAHWDGDSWEAGEAA